MVAHDFDNPVYQAEEENDEDCDLPEELARLLRQEEKAIQPQYPYLILAYPCKTMRTHQKTLSTC